MTTLLTIASFSTMLFTIYVARIVKSTNSAFWFCYHWWTKFCRIPKKNKTIIFLMLESEFWTCCLTTHGQWISALTIMLMLESLLKMMLTVHVARIVKSINSVYCFCYYWRTLLNFGLKTFFRIPKKNKTKFSNCNHNFGLSD